MPRPEGLSHYEFITSRAKGVPKRPEVGAKAGELWLYVEYLEWHLAFEMEAIDDLHRDHGSERQSHEALWGRWKVAYDKLKAIDAILHPPEKEKGTADA